MAVVVIDTIKPKNNGTFPVVEAVDVKVTNDKRLDAALNDKANQSDLTALQTTVASKASQADLTALSETVSGKASQADVTALSETVAGKQNALTTEQLAAANSGITSELVTQIGTNTAAIAGKASAADLATTNVAVATKAETSDLTTATTNLQSQIDNIVSGSTADSEVINARVGADGTSYNTLKARLDAEADRLEKGTTTNYFDKSRLYTGRINGVYGKVLDFPRYRFSDYIKTTETTIYFSQLPSAVYFFLNGVQVAGYTSSQLVSEGDGWYSTPETLTTHDGFAFEFIATEMNIDTLVVSDEVKSDYVAFTGYTTLYGEENAALQDVKALNDKIYRDIAGINTTITDINNNYNSLKSNIVYNDKANVLNPDTLKVGKRPSTTKGQYDTGASYTSTDLISVANHDKIYFNITPYQIFIWNTSGTLVDTPKIESYTDEGDGWYSYTINKDAADSMVIYWRNDSGGYDPNTSMIAINIKSDDFIKYGEDYTILYGDRVAKYSDITFEAPQYTLLPGSLKRLNYRIDNSLSVGDTIALVAQNYRSVMITSIPKGAVGIFLEGTFDATYPKYAIVDEDGKVLKIATVDSAASDVNVGYYVDISAISSEAKTVYFECSSNSDSVTVFWEYDKNDFNICKGIPQGGTFSSATATKNIENDMPVMVREFSNSDNVEYINFTEMQHCRSVGLWLKISDYNSLSAITGVRVSLYKNNVLATTDEDEKPQVFQMCDWIFLKVRTLDYEFDEIKITITFSDTTKTLLMEIGAYPILNHYNRPILSINFDQTWQATADCGAYDALFDNGIPFTITGHISNYLEKIQKYAKKGLLDIGSYAGDTDGTTITDQMTLSEILAALNERIDDKVSEGYSAPVSFGGGGHTITPLLNRALQISNYKAVKAGMLYGINCVTSPNPNYIYISGNVNMAMTMGSVYLLFAHGVSSNPSEEDNPAMYMSYSDFQAILSSIIANANSGGALVLNMKEYSDYMAKHKLIG